MLGTWSHQLISRTDWSILANVPSRDFPSDVFRDQHLLPYRRMDSTVARKNYILSSLDRFDFHTTLIPFSAFQHIVLRTLISWFVLLTQEPRYLKSSTVSRGIPFADCSAVSGKFKEIALVFFAFDTKPILGHPLYQHEESV